MASLTEPGVEEFRAGNARFEDEKFEEALACYERAVAAAPENGTYRFNRALTLTQLERYPAALEELHHLLELEPTRWDVRYLIGEVRARLGEKVLALANLREALARKPGQEEVLRALRRLTDDGDQGFLKRHRVLGLLRVVDRSEPEEEQPSLYIPSVAEVARTGSDETLVVSIERSLRSIPEDGDWSTTLKRAVLLSALHRREAGPTWERLLHNEALALSRTELLARAVRSYYEAAEWSEILRLQGVDPPPPTQSIARQVAHALLAEGRPADAVKVLHRIVEPSARTLRALAGAYLAEGDRELALTAAKRAVEEARHEVRTQALVAVADRSWFASRRPLDELAGLEDVKAQVRERVVLPLLVPELYLSGTVSNKFLMMGPPGCGKTTIARVAAKEAHAHLRTIHLTSVLNLFTGNSEANLTALFMDAKDATADGPVVLLVDEVDSIAIRREAMTQAGEHRLVTHFMDELDQLRGYPNLVVLAATNLPFELDSAVLRSGRLGTPLYVGPPNVAAREALLERHLRAVPHDGLDAATLARELQWYSPADIEHAFSTLRFTRNARALSGEDRPLTAADIHAAFREIAPSVRNWLHQVLDRLQADPSLQGFITGDLQRDLDAVRSHAREETATKEAGSGMFR